jgi:hypothetical protein
MQTLSQINQVYSPQEEKKMVNNEFIQNMVGNITSDLLVQNTLKRLEAYAKGELETKGEAKTEETKAERLEPKKRTTKAKKSTTAAPAEDAPAPETVETVTESKPKPKRAKKSE